MTKYYLKPYYGDVVYTDQVKTTQPIEFNAVGIERYLSDISLSSGKPKDKFVFRGKRTITATPEIKNIPIEKQKKVYGPKLPTAIQKEKIKKLLDAELNFKVRQMERRLSRSTGWTYNEVIAIASAMFVKGVQSVKDIADSDFEAIADKAITEAPRSIQDWQDYEVENFKKMVG